jgi:hypothetical protein
VFFFIRVGDCQHRDMSVYFYLHEGLDAMALPQSKPPAAFRKYVLALLGENYGDKTLVLCPTAFVTLLDGDHKAAILLAQILYWGDRTKDPEGWFYKAYSEWKLETGLSEAQVRRIVNGDPRVQSTQVTLRDLGVETMIKKVKRTGAPTLHYRINHTQFLTALERLRGQGDSQQCEDSTLHIEQDEPFALPGMNSEQCQPSLISPETTNPKISAEEYDHQSPAHHPDEDSDFDIFVPFENRFGKLKESVKDALREELMRLGSPKIIEVIERCVGRARSWNYVVRALANEKAASVETQSTVTWATIVDTGNEDEEESALLQPQKATPTLFISERVRLPWEGGYDAAATVQEAWGASYHQLELQLDRASFETYLRGASLVDYEPESQTFVVVVRTPYARDFLQYRLDRLVKRILGDVYGQPALAQFLTIEDWRLQERCDENVAIA